MRTTARLALFRALHNARWEVQGTLTISASFSPRRTLRSISDALGTVNRNSKILFRSLS